MKLKVLLKNLIFLGTFFIVLPVFATSGACSYHNGVNCGTGPDFDGSIICNDGWSESSVSYTSSDECQSYLSCNDSEYASLKEKYGINELKSQYQSLINEINSIKAQLQIDLVAVESKPIPMQSIIGQQNRLISDANTKLSPLISQANNIQSDLNYKLATINKECEQIGKNRIQEIALIRLQMKLNAEKEQEQIRQQQILAEAERLAREQIEIEQQKAKTVASIPVLVVPSPVTPTKKVEEPVKKVIQKTINTPTTTESSTIQTTSTERKSIKQIFNEQKEQKEQKVSKIRQFFNFLLNLFR